MEYREFTDSDGFKYRRKVPIQQPQPVAQAPPSPIQPRRIQDENMPPASSFGAAPVLFDPAPSVHLPSMQSCDEGFRPGRSVVVTAPRVSTPAASTIVAPPVPPSASPQFPPESTYAEEHVPPPTPTPPVEPAPVVLSPISPRKTPVQPVQFPSETRRNRSSRQKSEQKTFLRQVNLEEEEPPPSTIAPAMAFPSVIRMARRQKRHGYPIIVNDIPSLQSIEPHLRFDAFLNSVVDQGCNYLHTELREQGNLWDDWKKSMHVVIEETNEQLKLKMLNGERERNKQKMMAQMVTQTAVANDDALARGDAIVLRSYRNSVLRNRLEKIAVAKETIKSQLQELDRIHEQIKSPAHTPDTATASAIEQLSSGVLTQAEILQSEKDTIHDRMRAVLANEKEQIQTLKQERQEETLKEFAHLLPVWRADPRDLFDEVMNSCPDNYDINHYI